MSYIEMDSEIAGPMISDSIDFYKNKILDYDNEIKEITKPVERKFLWFKWVDNDPCDRWDKKYLHAIWNRADCCDYCKRLILLLRMANNADSIKLSVEDFKLIH